MTINELRTQYNEGFDFLRARKQRQVSQLALMNNLQRGDQNIASTMLFSMFNRVHSSLYSDVLTVKFVPPEDADYKKTELLNKLQINDYREMEKWKIDYDWLWNTLFYGDGFVSTLNWDKKRKMMEPEVWNNLLMIYDPYFAEPKEWRYYGTWITKSGQELLRLQKLGLLEDDFELRDLQQGYDPDMWSYKVQHDAARMGTGVPDSSYLPNNNVYQLFEMYSYEDDGTRYVFWTDKSFSKIIRKKKLNLKSDEPWPIVRKQIFREPNSSISISIPDLLEDKHRAKNVLYNLMLIAAKDEANPIYAYNPDVVKDVSQFFQRQVEQHIPMDNVETGYKRLNMGSTVSPALLQFVSLLNSESSDAIGTSIVQPITPRGKKSATESALAQQIADQASALQSKVLGAGEKEFWSHWYQLHLKNMSDADEKVITLTSINTITFESIKLEDIKTKFPPKIEIMSQRDADYKELVMRRDLMQIYPEISKSMNPKSKQMFDKYVFYPKFIKDSSTVDRIIPKTVDEIVSEQENLSLEKNNYVNVSPNDDDEMHLYVHYMIKKTPATWAHILAHQKQYSIKKQQPAEGEGGQIKNYTDNNQEGAVPLQQEMGDQNAKSSLTLTQ